MHENISSHRGSASDCRARSRPATRRTCFTARVRGGRRMFAETIRNTRPRGDGTSRCQRSQDASTSLWRSIRMLSQSTLLGRGVTRYSSEADMPPGPSRLRADAEGSGRSHPRPACGLPAASIAARGCQPPLRSRRVRPASSRAPSAPPPMPDPGTPHIGSSSLQGPALERSLAGSLQGLDARVLP